MTAPTRPLVARGANRSGGAYEQEGQPDRLRRVSGESHCERREGEGVLLGDLFGWAFKDWGDDYADTTSSGAGSGFNADPEHRRTKPLVVIYAPDLDAAHDKVVAAGGKVTKEVFSFPGGKRFHFTDPCGNELAVWSDRCARRERSA